MRPFDFLAATREIELRNRIRAESGCLPSLNIALELEKLRELHQQRDFQSYIEQHRPLYQRTLRRAVFKFKKSHGGQNPNFISGMGIHACLNRMFRKRYEVEPS